MPVLAGSAYGFTQTQGWSAVLGGVMVQGGTISALGHEGETHYCGLPTVRGCLQLPPDGLGQPEMRTQDVTYVGRDGVQHHEDWYQPRIVTLTVSIGKDGGCGCGPGDNLRQAVRDLVQEWGRVCDGDLELVIYPPNCLCDGSDNTQDNIDRPLGIIGRPRAASVTYTRNGTADLILRFDAKDHLMYLLDCCGTIGSGEQCLTMFPTTDGQCRHYPRCYTACPGSGEFGWRYDDNNGSEGGPLVFDGGGTECVGPTIHLIGPLSSPRVVNMLTGQSFIYQGNVAQGSVVIVDLTSGTASENGQDRTIGLLGDVVMTVSPGNNEWELLASGTESAAGSAQICWRPAVIVA